MSRIDNCLSRWFPLIKAAGLPVPETRIIRTDLELARLAYGEEVDPVRKKAFQRRLAAAATAIGYPVFLRTGQTSGKHYWTDTCFLTCEDDLPSHVYELVEFSCMADLMGLPLGVWVVREMLPTKPFFTAFKGMPICREFRLFVDGPEIVCVHPYWPLEAFEPCRDLPENFRELHTSMCELSEAERDELCELASRAGLAVGGRWSVDLLETTRGWYLTDMARAETSYHWPGCENEKMLRGESPEPT